MKKFKWFGAQSIRSSMNSSFLTLIVCALLVFLVVSLRYTQRNILENSIFYSREMSGLMNREIDSYIDYMENISKLVAENEDVPAYLFSEDETREERYKRIMEQFNTVMQSRTDIANIGIILDGTNYLINDGTGKLNPYIPFSKVEWIQNTMSQREETSLSYSHVQNLVKDDYRWVITLSRTIRNPVTNERQGLFFIDLNYDVISDLCENNIASNRGYVFIVDEQGQMIYHPKQQLIYSGLMEENIDMVLHTTEDYFVTEEHDSRLYTMSRSNKTGWTVVGVAYVDELMKDRSRTQAIFFLTAGILTGLAVLFSSLLAEKITRPILRLKESMKEVERGNFENANVPVEKEDEIGSLSRSFNVMTEEIQKLMRQNVEEQKDKRKMELKALQAQINPHFLYNTLDSIIWMAESGENEDVVTMTSSLAHMMRQSFNNKEEEIRMEKEIEYVRSYLIIQKMRYQDKLNFEIDMEPDILHVTIIKLVLQPLVENAIYHGIKYKDGIGLITVCGYVKEGAVVIEIADNGNGMEPERLLHVFDEHKVNYKSNGVGVYNVQKRLQLYYGNDYGLHYVSRLGEGTTVTVKIPMGGEQR